MFRTPLGEMEDQKIDGELKTYSKHTDIPDLPDGDELAAIVVKHNLDVEAVPGDKRKRAQLAKTRDIVAARNKTLPAKRKKTG